MKKARKIGRSQPRRRATPFTLGREQFAKISAVEGLMLTEEILREFEEFDRNKTSAQDRRRAIIGGYAKSTV
jgi:hypothetical protein